MRADDTERNDLRRRVIWLVIAAAVVSTVLILTDALIHHVLINVIAGVAITAAVLVAIWMIRSHRSMVQHAYWYTQSPDSDMPSAGFDYRMFRLRRHIRGAVETEDDRLYQVISALTRDRLLSKHDVDLHQDRAAAERFLGRDLAEYLRREGTIQGRKGSLRPLQTIVSQLEEI